MEKSKKDALMNCSNLDELLDVDLGKKERLPVLPVKSSTRRRWHFVLPKL